MYYHDVHMYVHMYVHTYMSSHA